MKMAAIQDNRRNILRSSFGVSVATILSRILGLFRVMLEARVLGGGGMASAWLLACKIPNLFRKLFGEGALSTALIPLLSHVEAEEGLPEARRRLTGIFLWLGLLLAVIVVAVSAAAFLLRLFITEGYVHLALRLIPLLMPYTVFICFVGVMTAVVNTRRVFFLASLNALVLNIVLVALLYYGLTFGGAVKADFLDLLAVGVLGAGLLQLLMMAYLMKRSGIFPIWRNGSNGAGKAFRELFLLALPGMIGAGAVQVSLLVDQLLAIWVGNYAIASLSFSERLVYLPVGVFAMALSSVLMADMSRAAARKDFREMADDCVLGLRYVWYFCAPLGVFMVVWREPLIRLLFMHGNFNEFHMRETAWALLFYALGIPAFCATKVILPMFYARKEMVTPLKISLCAIAVNLVASPLLMLLWKQGGIALATVVSAMANNFLLLFVLARQNFALPLGPVVRTAVKAVAGSLAGACCYFYDAPLREYLERHPAFSAHLPADLVSLALAAAGFGAVYLLCSVLLRMSEPGEMLQSLRRKKRRL